ncbi:hypothetical protein OJAV_G00222800 [Oryzias javanicus]|uniref:Uncharacterized protein n=1 Tax=Oryzias javanicus TaxID=123683 RepID=A0A437C1H6_ORYJA|nr:hypothetical protein OJAV_G00222800 [Oryzias javanicus]
MDFQHTGRMGGRHLSQIQEESDSREHSTTFQPVIVSQQRTGEADKPALDEEQEPDGNCQSEPSSLDLNLQDKMLENRSLLEELVRIEAELRGAELQESVHLDEDLPKKDDLPHQQKNRLQWQTFFFLGLSQRVSKPWASSYFRTFPMHMYCLPVQSAGHKCRTLGQKKSS